jgi:glycosyltransferase involved in cell wall biosynthesis
MKRQPLACWIVVNSVPYHEARLNAAAEQARLRVSMIQLTGVDTHWTFDKPERGAPKFSRQTLFPDTPWQRIDGKAMARSLVATLTHMRPDVVCINGWSYGGAIAALGWCVSQRVPAVMMSESTALDHPRRYWREAIKHRIVGLCSASLVGGSRHRDYIAELGAPLDRVFTGYDAVDNDYFQDGADAARRMGQQQRQRLGLPQRYFMACSRLIEKKNIARLLRAYAGYRGKETAAAPWSLVIVGEGELKQELLALQAELGLQSCVQFVGEKNYDELPTYYGLASAFVHASTSEQWGLVVNEAMAAGLPVVVSERCGCAADLVVSEVNGLTFDPYDIDDFSGAMLQIVTDDVGLDMMGRASREIIARWSPRRFAESLDCAVQAALGAEPPIAGAIDRLVLWGMRER